MLQLATPGDLLGSYVHLFGWFKAFLHGGRRWTGGGAAASDTGGSPVLDAGGRNSPGKISGDCARSAWARAIGAGGRPDHGREAGCRCGTAAGSSGNRESAVGGLLNRRVHAV